jgi:hypothetical protein
MEEHNKSIRFNSPYVVPIIRILPYVIFLTSTLLFYIVIEVIFYIHKSVDHISGGWNTFIPLIISTIVGIIVFILSVVIEAIAYKKIYVTFPLTYVVTSISIIYSMQSSIGAYLCLKNNCIVGEQVFNIATGVDGYLHTFKIDKYLTITDVNELFSGRYKYKEICKEQQEQSYGFFRYNNPLELLDKGCYRFYLTPINHFNCKLYYDSNNYDVQRYGLPVYAEYYCITVEQIDKLLSEYEVREYETSEYEIKTISYSIFTFNARCHEYDVFYRPMKQLMGRYKQCKILKDASTLDGANTVTLMDSKIDIPPIQQNQDKTPFYYKVLR